MNGTDASITLDGMRRLNPDFKQTSLQIYLDKGADAGAITDTLQKEYKDRVVSAINVDKVFKVGMGPYIDIILKIGIATMFVTIFVVLLVLYFIIDSSIIRRRRELGIQKAISFSTLQLMNQLSSSIVFPILTATALGCILGATRTNAHGIDTRFDGRYESKLYNKARLDRSFRRGHGNYFICGSHADHVACPQNIGIFIDNRIIQVLSDRQKRNVIKPLRLFDVFKENMTARIDIRTGFYRVIDGGIPFNALKTLLNVRMLLKPHAYAMSMMESLVDLRRVSTF